MKKCRIFLVIFSLVGLSYFAKGANENTSSALLFPQFEYGYAVQANGNRVRTSFNYDKVGEHMLFVDIDGTVLKLFANTVSAVIIGDRRFVPRQNDSFYERVIVGDNAFYIRHRATPVSRGMATGMGTYSSTGAAVAGGILALEAALAMRQGTRGLFPATVHEFAASERFQVVDNSAVYLRDGRRSTRVNSLNVLTRRFRPQRTSGAIDKRPLIEAFARENNTSFRNVEDVKAIVTYAFSL